jgi:hypothetical protein
MKHRLVVATNDKTFPAAANKLEIDYFVEYIICGSLNTSLSAFDMRSA